MRIICLFICFNMSYARTVAQYNPSIQTATRKQPGIVQAIPIDPRSVYYDAAKLLYRPYQSTAEVLAYLNVAESRVGNFPIYVNEGGTLKSNGTFTGGTITEYWFFNGTANSNLVVRNGVIVGTVAELRAMNTNSRGTYMSVDRGGGTWKDIGPNNGKYEDDGATHIIARNNRVLERMNMDMLNVKWWDAKGDSATNDSQAIASAITYAKKLRNNANFKGKNVKVYFPPGKFRVGSPIFGAIGVDLIGEGENQSVIFSNDKNLAGIIMYETNVPGNLAFIYTHIENLSIRGGSYNENPFGYKNTSIRYVGANGIELHNHRIKITNCTIEGFNESGITSVNADYVYVDHCKIFNNKIGYVITDLSTTNYLTYSEVQLNGMGVLIQNNSFSNTISDNVIEANFTNFYDLNDDILFSKGKGIVLASGAKANTIKQNHLEAHITTISIDQSSQNDISKNKIAPGLAYRGYRSDVLTYYGASKDNSFENNTFLFSNDTVKATIRVLNPANNYSSDYYAFTTRDFNKVIADNLKIWQGQFKANFSNAPLIADITRGVIYRKLKIDSSKYRLTEK
jgi:hypothetical protein